jgi:SAM-dependent methyltransferase
MLKRPVTSDDLTRLRDERDLADRRYNEALTALDRALPRFSDSATSPAPFDETQITPLNTHWAILAGHTLPPARGLRSRLAHLAWSVVSPLFERQQAFNSLLVDHLNRNVGSARESAAQSSAAAQQIGEHAAALAAFQSHLILYLQQVTAYVDTKDRLVAGSLMSVYDAALNGLTDELLKRWESLTAREARFEGRVAGLTGAHEDLRATLATVQQATLTLKREVERALTSKVLAVSPDGTAAAGETAGTPHTTPPALDSYKYVGFEDRFRGSRTEIRQRLTSYLPLFAGATDVLDVGCGRGEFLELAQEAGIGARGLDVNHAMVEACRARGLDVAEGDLLSYLDSLPDASLGGLIAVQVVEHLEPEYLMRALDLAYHKLRPGSRVVLETINPACWFAFFSSYIRDLSHVRPLHPDTLSYLLTASGFGRVHVDYRAPYPDSEKLQHVAPDATPALSDLTDTMNANSDRLNALLFTFLDYAAIGERL